MRRRGKLLTMNETQIKAPWLDHYGEIPKTLTYFEGTMCEAIEQAARDYPRYIAYDFMGKRTTYRDFVKGVERCARGLKAIGVRAGDRVTICMPNCPQAVQMFYAVNLAGAVSNMIHPLSGENEIVFYLKESQSKVAVTLDLFYHKFKAIAPQIDLNHLIITGAQDALPPLKRAGYLLTRNESVAKSLKNAPVLMWKDFLRAGERCEDYREKRDANDPAVILYSGGTTGTTKGILLSNRNFNALGAQVRATNPMYRPGDKMLAVMPLFHGFGLGVSIHTMLMFGGRCILVPRFTAESYAKLIRKYRCHFIAGVPTLYEALMRQPVMDGADLSCLKGVFSGGDSLSAELKKKFDLFLKEHNASIRIREGYGTTECVTASCLTPLHKEKEGSIGQPFPDMYYKIVCRGGTEEVPYGQEGEICISGPTVMLGYLDHPEETAATMRVHDDGRTWIHTGDLGVMDEEGFVYFRQRIKRMIVTSGYNVYPSQLENILDAHPSVQMSCVIGVPDSYKMQKVKAFVMLKEGVAPDEKTREELLRYCRKNIAKYAMPYAIEFRETLPKTLVGKVAYRQLEEEELQKTGCNA